MYSSGRFSTDIMMMMNSEIHGTANITTEKNIIFVSWSGNDLAISLEEQITIGGEKSSNCDHESED